MKIIIIGLCLWAIALEWKLRRQDEAVEAMTASIIKLADGEAKVFRQGGTIKIQLINKEK
jgi:hypothetical protein